MPSEPWWRGAVIYQVYPRSFQDSNGDGIGDLPGLISRLDHIAAVGADAVWLSPIHPSPNRDFGYDVSDYLAIAPEMGTMADFERLLREAHARGLKVILDEVLSHTSDEHPWFVESRSSPDNPKADWYVWADPRADGTPPNNWLAVFGGAAWSYFPARRQYYFHKFLRQQPKLNLWNKEVRTAALDVLRFWLDKGVDGFRLDVANSFLHDPDLADNPPVPAAARGRHEWGHVYHQQQHTRDANLPENRAVLDDIRALAAAYPEAFVFGEFSEAPELLGHYAGAAHGLHSGYTFTFLEDRSFAPHVFADHAQFLSAIPGLWPCVTFSNHDVSRTVSRYGRGTGDARLARLALSLLLCLRGTVLLFQGEELGLTDAPIRRDQLRDPFGDLYYPLFKGRDPCRTPMPWVADAPAYGFTTGVPWLPPAPDHRALAADVQAGDPSSTYAFARRLIALRRQVPALVRGDMRVVQADARVLVFLREAGGQQVLCAFNLSDADADIALPPGSWEMLPIEIGGGVLSDGRARLPGRSAVLASGG